MAVRLKRENEEFARFTEMAKRQLSAETAKYDEEFSADEFGPLDVKSQQRWKQFKRSVGRPRIGAGAVRVSVSMERGLLQAVDYLAKQMDVKRAELISSALLQLIATDPLTNGVPTPKAKKSRRRP